MPDIQPNFTPQECLRQLEEAYLADFWQDEINTYRKRLALPEEKASLATRLRVSRYLNAMQVAVQQAKLLAAIDTARITGDEAALNKYAPYFARFETIDYETYVEARDDVLRSLMGAARKPYPRQYAGRRPGSGGCSRGDDSPSLDLKEIQRYENESPMDALIMGRATIKDGMIVRIPTPDNPNPKPFPPTPLYTKQPPQPREPMHRAAPTPRMPDPYEPLLDDTQFEELAQQFPPELQAELIEFGNATGEWARGRSAQGLTTGKGTGLPPAYPERCLKFLEANAHKHPLLQRELDEVNKDKQVRKIIESMKGPGGGPAPDA